MDKLNYVSAQGTALPLINNELFDLIDFDGQTSIATDISSVVIGGVDGDTTTNVQAQPRSINLSLKIKSGVEVERAKREILNVVKLKQRGTLVWKQADRTVEITGMVEAVEMPRWANGVLMQISLHCEQPFWEDSENFVEQISESAPLHYFTTTPNEMLYFTEEGIVLSEHDVTRTKTITNHGDVSVGMEIRIKAMDSVTNPIIYDEAGRFFGIGYSGNAFTMASGDIVVITTHKGNKTVTMNGKSLFDKIKPQSTWLQLEAGNNTFSIDSDDDSVSNMNFTLAYKRRYI